MQILLTALVYVALFIMIAFVMFISAVACLVDRVLVYCESIDHKRGDYDKRN